MENKDQIVIMCHRGVEPTLQRHLPYWRQHGSPLLFFSPADKPVRVEGHENLSFGHASHHGPGSIARFRQLLSHLRDAIPATARRLILFEYDSFAVSKHFPETRDDVVTSNAFTNRQPEFGSKWFTHPPIVIPVALLPKICEAMAYVPDTAEQAFWDRWLPVVIEKAGIEIVSFVEHTGQGYSQNTIEIAHLDSFHKAINRGVRVVHGVKDKAIFDLIDQASPWRLHTSAGSIGRGLNYISFAVWGDSAKYWVGLERNLELAQRFYPGWWTRVYVPNDTNPDVLEKLTRSYVSVKFIPDGIPNMLSRFLIHDSPDCLRFIVRDADSRLSAREVAAVDEWIASGRILHTMRDHLAHSSFPICGGMWGGLGGKLVRSMEGALRSWLQNHAASYAGHDPDQRFLADAIYPACKHSRLEHDTFSSRFYPGSQPFPTPREPADPHTPYFVGEVFDHEENCREGDRQMILSAEAACLK